MSFQHVAYVMALICVLMPHRAALAQAIEDAVIANMPASHEELGTITIKKDPDDLVGTFAMTSDGRLMASISRWSQGSDREDAAPPKLVSRQAAGHASRDGRGGYLHWR